MIRNTKNKILGMCARTRGLRRLAQRAYGPSFFDPNQKYGPLDPDFRNKRGRFLVSAYPKSGNVWVTSLVASCLDLEVDGDDRSCIATYTHHALEDATMFDPDILRGVVVIRDLRDCIVSLYHFMRTNHFIGVHGPHHIFDDIEDMYFQYYLVHFWNRICSPAALPEGYLKLGWPMVRYEKLIDQPEKELRRLFDRWGVDVSDEKIADGVQKNTLDSLRKGKGKTQDNIEVSHFRKGGYGNYKDELPGKVLSDIETRFGDYLRRWGYL